MKMKKLYIASPMFCQSELEFNEKVALVLEKNGFEVFCLNVRVTR